MRILHICCSFNLITLQVFVFEWRLLQALPALRRHESLVLFLAFKQKAGFAVT